MIRISAFKYLSVFTLPVLAWFSFRNEGWITFVPLFYAFFIIPLLELFFKPDRSNVTAEEEVMIKEDPIYDWLLYLVVPIQVVFVVLFLESISQKELGWLTISGRISAMGLLCGVMGINVAHELGHRKTWYERLMAKILLLTSMYMHFYIEHNRGHHRNVSTPEDPSSARKGESLYRFWVRSVSLAYISAWKIEAERLRKNHKSVLSWNNEMLWFQLIQIGLLITIFAFYGVQVMLYYLVAAVIGFLLLETVNYIEHYGLERKQQGTGYERVMPWHSWNSDHVIGRIMLFELSRHSDHHYIASRKYQVLRHMEKSPQMPTGYPGMMLMASFPPIWFAIMNKRLDSIGGYFNKA